MNRKLTLTIVTAVIFLIASNPVWGQSRVDEINALKEQLDAQQKMISEMQQKVNTLEKKKKVSPPSTARLDSLEQELEVAHEQNMNLFNELKKRVKVNLYGTLEYADFQYRKSFDQNENTFNARDFLVQFDVRASKRFRLFMGIQCMDDCIRCHRPSPGTSTSVQSTVDRGSRDRNISLTQGWIEYGISPYITPRFGAMLVPFGRYNLEHYDTNQDLISVPLMALDVVPTVWNEAGAGFVGSVPVGDIFTEGSLLEDFEINYQVFAVNGLTDHAIEDTGLGMARGKFNQDNNNNKAIVGRLEVNLFPGVSIGWSGYSGEYDRFGNNIWAYDVDWKLMYGPVELAGEFANFDLDKGKNDNKQWITENVRGGFIEARYHFWLDFLNKTFLGQYMDNPTFTAVVRGGFAAMKDDGDNGRKHQKGNREERLAVGLNYRPIESLVFKMEYQMNRTFEEPLQNGTSNGFLASVSASF